MKKGMKDKPRLGIIDWGIGGISIYTLVKAELGALPITYLSDTGVTPYGKMTRVELVARLRAVCAFLQAQGVTHLVIGCNAASTALPWLQVPGLKIEGVIASAVETTVKLRPAKLALLGGRRTVLSGVYRQAFAAQGLKVAQRIAQPLSALIERGDVNSPELRAQCQRILAPIKTSSHILLACTHYPAVTPVLRELVRPSTVFIDPAQALVKKVKGWRLPTGGTDVVLTTGDAAAMQAAARQAFGVKLSRIRQVAL